MASPQAQRSPRTPRANPEAAARIARRRRSLWRFGGVLLLFLGAALVTLLVVQRYFDVGEVELPNTIGLELEQAAALLRAADLVPVSYPEVDTAYPPGAITSQTPSPGTVVRRGRTISLGVNTPPEAGRAPTLVGNPVDEVTQLLSDLNMPVTAVRYVFDAAPAGTVLAQQPEPGTVLEPSAGVTLLVSRGPNVPTASIPDVVGQPVDEAERQLRDLGFRRIERVAADVSFDSPGAVTAISPAPGTAVPVSSPIMLSYALPGTEVVKVPEVVGQSPRVAALQLQAAGLALGPVTYVDGTQATPTVTAVEPHGYTLIGTPVALTISGAAEQVDLAVDDNGNLLPDGGVSGGVSGGVPGGVTGRLDGLDGPSMGIGSPDGAVPGRRTIPFTFDPAVMGMRALTENPYHLRLVVIDDRGERVVLDRQVPAGVAVSTVVTIYGEAQLQTFINDIFFQAWNP